MKIFFLKPNEDWIVDRFYDDWMTFNSSITTNNPYNADVIWACADWCFDKLPKDLLKEKKVVTTIHHIVPEKFGAKEYKEFQEKDYYTTIFHVPNEQTRSFLSYITTKKIVVIPYWANQFIWKKTGDKKDFRKKYNLPIDAYLCGSMQRDTEGSGIKNGIYLPKLEKGPDLFCDYINELYAQRNDVHVVLAGWRRQYVINRFEKENIPYSYFELPSQQILNELYQTLDLYPVTSRFEGGPQSLIECGLLEIPMISTPVGMAEQVLKTTSISNSIIQATPSIPNIEHLKLPTGFNKYIELFSMI